MGATRILKRYRSPEAVPPPPLPRGLKRRKPRDYAEWRGLRKWGRLPEWEPEPAGYLLREAREDAGLTQAELARRLGISQQAVSRAERWEANPTVGLMDRWARACERDLEIRLTIGRTESSTRVDGPTGRG